MPYSTPTAAELKAQWDPVWRHRPKDLQLRIRRALSWIERAEKEKEAGDLDATFIFYWIAFNAAYARRLPSDSKNKPCPSRDTREEDFPHYFRTLFNLDSDQRISDVVWEQCRHSIAALLHNEYIYEPLWNDPTNGGGGVWKKRFKKDIATVDKALFNRDTLKILSILFKRLSTLRNQLMHGSATWESSVNRDQVLDGAAVMALLIPVFVKLMMEHPKVDWGPPYYPVVYGD